MRRFIVVAAAVAAALGTVGVASAQNPGIAPVNAVQFPSNYSGQIYVGNAQVWPTVPSTSTTPTTVQPTPTTVGATTTSTVRPTTTSTVRPTTTTSTVRPTTTTAPPASPTTVPSTTAPAGARCGLSAAAFCATFDAARPVAGSRSGDLDADIWGVSRINSAVNPGQGQLNQWQSAIIDGQPVQSPNDIKITGGQLREAVTDGGNQTILAMYPKQPFDFAGRTGKIVFDVNADSDDGHAAWPEFWITDQPVPAPGPDAPGVYTFARNSFGFAVDQQNGSYPCSNNGTETGIGSMWATSNYQLVNVNWTNVACVKKGTLTSLNHFEVRMSLTRTEVWGSDGGGGNFKLMAYTTDTLPLTRGVIWVNDVHYNACKYTDQCSHQFNWDNVGFDGPTPYRDLTFDVADNIEANGAGTNLGYLVTPTARTFTVQGVRWEQAPTAAYVLLNWHPESSTEVPQVSVNGNPFVAMANPFSGEGTRWRTIAIAIPISQVVAGTNTIAVKGATTVVANINLGLIAAAPVRS